MSLIPRNLNLIIGVFGIALVDIITVIVVYEFLKICMGIACSQIWVLVGIVGTVNLFYILRKVGLRRF